MMQTPDGVDLQPPAPCSATVITTLPALEELAERMLACPVVAIDTESDSLYSYTEKICLVQISLPDVDYIIDPLTTYSLEPLAPVMASPKVEKVFHGADYDLVSLKRGYGFHITHIFDTMIAARILGRRSFGLAAMLAENLGVQVDKSMQRSDWGQRPLTTEQLTYACRDTRYLLVLRDILLKELRSAGREAEAREIFAELATLEPKSRFFDPDAFWNMKGVRDLDPAGQRIVQALYRWRDEQARREDRPVFKVLSDRTIVALAHEKPAGLDVMRRSHLLSPYQLARFGRQIAEMANKARRQHEALPPPRRRSEGGRPSDETLLMYDSLRTWRKQRAEARGVEPDIIMSNDALMTLASRRPRTMAELQAIPGLGQWRRREYGADIVAVISGEPVDAAPAGGGPDGGVRSSEDG